MAALVAGGVGCSSTGEKPSWLKLPTFSKSKKTDSLPLAAQPDFNRSYGDYAAEQQGRSIVSPGLGVSEKKPNAAQKLATSIGESSVVKAVTGAFKKPSKPKGSGTETTTVDPLSLSHKSAPPGADFYVSVARMLENNNNTSAAIEQYERALKADPAHLPALLGVARLYDRQGRLPEASKYYAEAVRRHPRDAAPANDLGLCYARQERYEEAAASLRKAVELQPDRVLYRNNLATVLVQLNRVDEAVEQLSAVHPKATVHYNIGYLLNRRGDKKAALRQFDLAVQADPDFDAAKLWADALRSGRPTPGPADTAALNESPAQDASAGAAPSTNRRRPVAEPVSTTTSPTMLTVPPEGDGSNGAVSPPALQRSEAGIPPGIEGQGGSSFRPAGDPSAANETRTSSSRYMTARRSEPPTAPLPPGSQERYTTGGRY